MLFGRVDTVWDVNARNIAPAFLINTGYSVEEEKEMRSSKTGNEAVDGKYSVFSFFETPGITSLNVSKVPTNPNSICTAWIRLPVS